MIVQNITVGDIFCGINGNGNLLFKSN